MNLTEVKNLTEVNPGKDKPKNEKTNLSEVGPSGPKKRDADEEVARAKKQYLKG
jgi:hypothetical protein